MSKTAEIAKIYEINSIEDADFIMDQCIKDGYYSVEDKVAYLVGKYTLSNMQIKSHDVIETVSQEVTVTMNAASKSKRGYARRFLWGYEKIEDNGMIVKIPVKIFLDNRQYDIVVEFNKIPSLKELKEKYGEDKKGRSQYITERKLLHRQITERLRRVIRGLGFDSEVLNIETITNAAWSPIERYFPYEKPYKK